MSVEALARKLANKELGVEGTDWFMAPERGHEKVMFRITTPTNQHGALFDLRETHDSRSKLGFFNFQLRLRSLKEHKCNID